MLLNSVWETHMDKGEHNTSTSLWYNSANHRVAPLIFNYWLIREQMFSMC